MPTLNMTEALQEAYATASTTAFEYYTFEFVHEDWVDEFDYPAPARIVWGWDQIDATMEAGYQLDVLGIVTGDPPPTVTFYPVPIQFSFGATVAGEIPTFNFEFYDPSKIVMQKIFDAQEAPKPIKMYARVHLSNRLLLGPETIPVPRYHVSSTKISSRTSKITGTCVFQDYMGRSAPFRTYTPAEFPGLRRR